VIRRLLALVLLAAAAAGCGGSGAHPKPPTAWRLETTPALPGTTLLAGVSCVSPSFCVAVGSHLRRLVSHTLVERWDGKAWHVVPTTGAADRRSALTAVSCVSSSFCAAVGNRFTGFVAHPLLEVWDGRAWQAAVGTGPAAALSGVSCSSARFCAAVGASRGDVAHPLVETWRGRGWTVTPVLGARGAITLAAVDCRPGPACVAVGQRAVGSGVSSAAASFDGRRWRLEPVPGAGSLSHLGGVGCVGSWCIAVGAHAQGDGTRTLVLRRDGGWTLRPSPSRTFMSGFTAVSCVAQTACVAVGTQRSAEANHALAAGWDGTQWSFAPTRNPGATDVLAAVSCTAAGRGVRCVAVGSSGPAFGLGSSALVLSARA
jgi:hypothetical protein